MNDDPPASESLPAFHHALESTFGPSDAIFHVPKADQRPGTPHVDVCIYRARELSFHFLITAGVSSLPQPSTETKEGSAARVELYTKVPASCGDAQLGGLARALWTVGQWPFRGDGARALRPWHLHHGLPPLAPDSKLDAFLLSPVPKSDEPLGRLQEQSGVTLLHAYGLTDGERRAAESAGLKGGALAIARLWMQIVRTVGALTDPTRDEVAAPLSSS